MQEYSSSLTRDTFLLGIQTEYQQDAMRYHGNKLICMDSTHGTNLYDFLLISVIVIDEYGEGLPVAWALSNHEDTAVLVVHLNQGLVKYIQLFSCQMMHSNFIPLGAQHMVVHHLSSYVCGMWIGLRESPSMNMLKIYHQLHVILLEQSKTQFHLQLQRFMSHLHENYFRYYEYFKRTYAGRCEEWAACYRVGCIANTNMFTESFHRLLKVVYLDGKQNRRVDTLLNTLLRIAQNMIYEQITKEEKGKLSHRKCEITKRHNTAVELVDSCTVVQKSEGDIKWKVQSQSNKETYYTINQLHTSCKTGCKLNCSQCGACIHMYSCSCIDYALHSTVCKNAYYIL